jgi:hypothetical protein
MKLADHKTAVLRDVGQSHKRLITFQKNMLHPIFSTLKMGQHFAWKCWELSTRLYGITSQKTVASIFTITRTSTVIQWNLIYRLFSYAVQTAYWGATELVLFPKYEEESVSRSQMDIKCKTCDIQTWKKHLFLNISSINTDTLAPSLCQCVVTCSIEVFRLLSQQFLHLHFNLFVIRETFAMFLDPSNNCFTRHFPP